jgi:hypothetical protein
VKQNYKTILNYKNIIFPNHKQNKQKENPKTFSLLNLYSRHRPTACTQNSYLTNSLSSAPVSTLPKPSPATEYAKYRTGERILSDGL